MPLHLTTIAFCFLNPWLLSGILATALAGEPVSIQSLLQEMTDRDQAARFPQPEFRLKQQSSYERVSKSPDDPKSWFSNHDFNSNDKDRNFIRIEENNGRKEWVLMDHKGAGALVRTWMPDGRKTKQEQKDAVISIYLDDSSSPVIEGPMFDLFNGTSEIPFPLAHKSLMSAVSFLPIPYARRCKVTINERPFFYQFTFREYPEGTAVKTFTMEDFRTARPAIQDACKTLLEPHEAPTGKDTSFSGTLAAGAARSINLPDGSNAVRNLSLKLGSYANPAVTRSVVIRMSFDGGQTVWCPIGDFFGCGIGLHPFQGWYRNVAEDGTLSCRWVMPYRESGNIAIVNLGDKPVDMELKADIGEWKWDDRSMLFHAAWRGQNPVPTRPYSDWNYVTLKGRGVYVGDTLTIMNPVAKWWGEGDEKIFVDGEKFPSLFGTGTEDYYGYSWGGKSTDFYEHPFHAQPRSHKYDKLNRKTTVENNTMGFSTETRTRALDTMPFGTSLQLDMEVWHWAKCDMAFGVGVYWYGDAATVSNRKEDPEGALAVPKVPAGGQASSVPKKTDTGAIECETMKSISKSNRLTTVSQNLKQLAGSWSADSHLFVKADKIGDFVELQFSAKGADPLRLVMHATRSRDYGIVRITINGQAGGEFDLYADKPVPTGPLELGTFTPVNGRFTLRAEVIGKNPKSKWHFFGLDCISLSRP